LDFFLHNFVDSVKLETAYSTDIQTSATKLSEERRALVESPYRTLTLRWNSISIEESERMFMALARAADQRTYIPLYMDQSQVLGFGPHGTDSIVCDTTNRRFYVGNYVLVYQQDPTSTDNRMVFMEKKKIVALSPGGVGIDGLTLDSVFATPPSFPRTFVVPLFWAEKEIENEVNNKNDAVCDVQATFREVSEQATIQPSEPADNVLPYTSYPILTLETNWVVDAKTRINRVGTRYHRGRSNVVLVQSSKNQFEYEYNFLFDTHADAFAFTKFFDSRLGRLIPFYAVSHVALWQHVVIDPLGKFVLVTAPPNGHIEDVLDFVGMIGLVLKDGSTYVRTLTAVTVLGPLWKFEWTDAIPGTPTIDKIRRFTRANLVRFATDALVEEWLTSEICKVQISVRDLVDEKLVDISNAPQQAPSVNPQNGGAIELGQRTYFMVWVDGLGNQSPPSPLATVTNAGIQRRNFVAVSETPPAGTVGARFFRNKVTDLTNFFLVNNYVGVPPFSYLDSSVDAALGPLYTP